MKIGQTKNISNLNNEELDNYVEEYDKEFDKFNGHMGKDIFINASFTKGTYWKHQQALKKS